MFIITEMTAADPRALDIHPSTVFSCHKGAELLGPFVFPDQDQD